MHSKEEEEIKKEFQLERVILFTDAVFAIIITIMVLEIKLPDDFREVSPQQMTHEIKGLIFKFLGYVVSFILVARFWMEHLKLFRYLKDYNTRLLQLNLLFLFTVTLFPFAVSLITGKVSDVEKYNWLWTLYVIVVYSSVFMQSVITLYLLKNKETLCIPAPNLESHFKWKVQKINLFILPALTAAIIIFNFYGLSFYFSVFTVVLYGVVIGKLSKKYYPDEKGGPLLFRLFQRRKKVIKTTKAE